MKTILAFLSMLAMAAAYAPPANSAVLSKLFPSGKFTVEVKYDRFLFFLIQVTNMLLRTFRLFR